MGVCFSQAGHFDVTVPGLMYNIACAIQSVVKGVSRDGDTQADWVVHRHKVVALPIYGIFPRDQHPRNPAVASRRGVTWADGAKHTPYTSLFSSGSYLGVGGHHHQQGALLNLGLPPPPQF